MSSLVLTGDTSGQVTLAAPAVAGTTTLTLQATTGTMALQGDVIGLSQTWQNLTASRALSTTYTNSTGKPIQVSVFTTSATVNATNQLTIGGVVVSTYCQASAVTGGTTTGIVPNGATYSVAQTGTSAAIQLWAELR